MKNVFSKSRRKNPHGNEGKENKEAPFFSKESKQPFFNVANGSAVQTKLAIGQPGDKYEKEADSMADAAVSNASKPEIQHKEISSIQRESLVTPQEEEKLGTAEQRMEEDKLVQEKPEIQKMGGEEEELQAKPEIQRMGQEEEEPIQMMGQEEEEPVQMKSEEEEKSIQMMGQEEESVQMMGEEEEEVQAKHNPNANKRTASTRLSNDIKEKSGKGKPLSKNVKAEMENSFGRDFSGVNIHTDQEAAQMNKVLGAQAFTHGDDIYFNSGKYSPDSSEGKRLLAHELTHTIQQKGEKKNKKSGNDLA